MTALLPLGLVRIKYLIASEMYNKRLIIIIIGVAQTFHNEQPVRCSLLLLLAQHLLRGGTLLVLVCWFNRQKKSCLLCVCVLVCMCFAVSCDLAANI